MEQSKIDNLLKIGTEWVSSDGSKHRIYVNDLVRWTGLQTTGYNSGNIRSATLDGKTISNSQAKKIEADVRWGKLYYDYADDRFHWTDVNGWGNTIVKNIREVL